MLSDIDIIRHLGGDKVAVQSAALRLFETGNQREVVRVFRDILTRIQKCVAESSESNNPEWTLLLSQTFSLYSPLQSIFDDLGIDSKNMRAILKALSEGHYQSNHDARSGINEHLVKGLILLNRYLKDPITQPGEMRIFYSWQSTSPASNRSLIGKALENAAKVIRNDGTVNVEPVIDRDTEGVAGSPDITDTIFEKIERSHAIACDVSLVNNGSPNPNVLIELGYAIKVLKWNRILMVINEAFGPVEKLPFDLRGKRTIKYNSPTDAEERASERKVLESTFERAIRAILKEQKRTSESPTNLPSIRLLTTAEDLNQSRLALHAKIQKAMEHYRFDYETERDSTRNEAAAAKGLDLFCRVLGDILKEANGVLQKDVWEHFHRGMKQLKKVASPNNGKIWEDTDQCFVELSNALETSRKSLAM